MTNLTHIKTALFAWYEQASIEELAACEDEVLQAIRNLEDAQGALKTFDLSEFIAGQKEADLEHAKDWREGR